MTREEILALEAGLELDKLVEVEIFGKTLPVLLYRSDVPEYSGDIKTAWRVVDKMVAKYGDFVLDWDDSYNGGHWSVSINRLRAGALAKIAPEAICKAALIAELKE